MARRLISLPFLTMAAWAVTLGVLIYDDNYQFFLAPKFGFLVAAGLVLSVIFAVSLAGAGINKDGDHTIKGLALMLPILFICSSGDSTLGSFALSKRTITPLETATSNAPSPGMPDPAERPDVVGNEFSLVPISDLIRNWDRYEDRRIRVEGLFANTVSGNESLSAVFRYFISCCAADAMPVGVFMTGQGDSGIKDSEWVVAGGRVEYRKIDGYDVIYMEVESLEKRAKPTKNAAYIF